MGGPGQPTVSTPMDAIVKASTAVLVTVAASRARPWTLVVLAGAAAATTSGAPAAAAWIALVAMVVLAASDVASTRRRPLQAAGAAAAYLCLFHQRGQPLLGASLLVAAAAVAPVLVSATRASGPAVRRRAVVASTIVVGVAAVAGLAFAVAGAMAYPHLSDGAESADAAIAAARAADEDAALSHLERASTELGRARQVLDEFWVRPVRYVPILGQHLRALQQVADEGTDLAANPQVIEAVSDYRGLKYESGRIDVDRVRALEAPVGATADLLHRSGRRLDAIDRTWLIGPVSSRVDSFEQRITRAADDASTAREVLRVMPALLGGDGDRHYFVAFTTPAEARGLGGFIGNYGELEAVDGRVRMTRSGSTSDIEPPVAGVRTLTGPQEYLDRYGQYSPADFLRDATFSPEFPSDADVIAQLYPQAGGSTVDGVIVMDPYAVAALLRFTGPIEVPGYPVALTSTNLPDIAVKQQYIDFADRNQDRKDILVEATEIAFDRLLAGDLPAPGKLIRALGPMVKQRRLLLWSPKPAEQRLFTAIDADGSMPTANGHDAFVLAHQNYGNNKVDAYLQRTIAYDVQVDQRTGQVDATATITLRNDAPGSGLPSYVIGNQRDEQPGSNVMNLTAFSALGVQSASLDGQPATLTRGVERGLNAYDLRLTIPPGQTRRLVLHLTGGVDLQAGPYRLTVAPQPSVNPDRFTVTVDGRAAVSCGAGDTVAATQAELTETVQVGAKGCRRRAS